MLSSIALLLLVASAANAQVLPKGPKGGLLGGVAPVAAPVADPAAPPSADPAAPTDPTSIIPSVVGNVSLPSLPVNVSAPVGNLTGASTAPPRGLCSRRCVRREWRSLSAGERQAYFNAVKQLRSGPAPTRYDQLVKYHMDASRYSHSTPYFLPWHRGYLRHYEEALQSVDPNVCLPYWNWSLDSQAPEYSPIFDDDAYGNTPSGCAGGALGNYNAYYPSPHCVTRSYNGGDNLGAFYSVEAVNRVVTSTSDYDGFRQNLESMIHPVVHVNIGGDMNAMHSPNDAIFFHHHAYIDYIWARWQKRNGYDFSGPGADRNSQMMSLQYKVDDVMDYSQICYDYADLAETDLAPDALPPPRGVDRPSGNNRPDMVEVVSLPDENIRWSPRDRSNLNQLRFPDQIPDSWCQMNGLNVGKVRGYEDDYRGMYRQLNNIKGYVSPCCLWKRPSLCRRLVGKTKKFCCDVPGYGRMEIGYNDEDPSQCLSNVRQRAQYTNSDVELPPDSYRSQVQKLVGSSAFDGAGSMKPFVDMDGASKQQVAAAAALGAVFAAAIAVSS